MLPVSQLLVPVSPSAPCGVDPSQTTTLSELEALLRREVSMIGSEVPDEPDWKAVEAQALATANICKDLRVGGILLAAAMRSQGLHGLRDGLHLIRGYLETYWELVFPLLDASDNNDPTERINAVANLAAPLGSDGDALRIIEAVRLVPILQGSQVGQFSLRHYLVAKGSLPWPAGAGSTPSLALLDAAAKEVGAAAIAPVLAAVDDCVAEANAVMSIFQQRLGPNTYPALDPLLKELSLIRTWLTGSAKSTLGPGGVAPVANGGDGRRVEESRSGPSDSFQGEIASREGVLRALDEIVRYYEKNEPSSPVPFVLKRVRRLVPMDFMQLITELTPESRDKILSITGNTEG